MASSAVALEDVTSVDIMTELLRRFKCSSKPDKRLILIGSSLGFVLFLVLFFLQRKFMFLVFSRFRFCYMKKKSTYRTLFWIL